MDLLNNISKRIRSESNWIDVAKQIGIDVNDIDKIKKKNNCSAEFVYTLTNKIWNVIFEYMNITTSDNGFVNITCIDKLGRILGGNITDGSKSKAKENLLKEIANRLGDWRKFARILGLEESDILAIEKMFPSPGLYIQRTLEVMKKLSHPLPPSTSWEFWRQYLNQFEDGKIVIGEIEMKFPSLLAQISDTGTHIVATKEFSYVGHPNEHKEWQSITSDSDIEVVPVRLGSDNFTDFQSISQWMDTKQQYADRYNVLKEINALNFIDVGNNECHILATLKSYLDSTNDPGFVVKGYHFVDHICLFKPGLFAKDIFDDHFFCFIANSGVILYITECSQGKSSALYHSTRNIQIANLLHKKLNLREILQINVIVNNNDDDDRFCKTCIDENLYVGKEIFKDPETFSKWFNFNICTKKVAFRSRSDFFTKKDFQSISFSIKKDMFAHEALQNTNLPSFSYCAEDQVEELEKIIVLTPPQMNALYSIENHIILRGPYGCGKSIVLVKRFEKIVCSADVSNIFYVIVNDQQSEFYHHLKSLQTKHPTRNIIVCQSKDIVLSLTIPKLSVILRSIMNLWPNQKTHVFIDEFSGSFFDKNEVTQLQNMLKLHYLNSHIVVTIQSMKESIIENSKGLNVDVGYQVDLLSEYTTFVTYTFEHSLRSSYEINEFVKETSKIIESSENKLSSLERFYSNGKFIDKEFGRENFKHKESRVALKNIDFKTNYSFYQSNTISHTVKSGPVKVFFLNRYEISRLNDKSRMYISVLSYILHDVSDIDKYVVCTYDKDLYNESAGFFEENSYNWTNNISQFININSQYEILLTDYASVRGFEFPNFVFMVSLGSKFLRYRILECLTRATTKLFVITDNMKISTKLFSRDCDSSIDKKLWKKWRKLKSSIFVDVKYDKSTDCIKGIENGNFLNQKVVTLKENVKKIVFGSVERFPWNQGVFLGSDDDDEKDGVLAVIKNLTVADNVDLLKMFIKTSNLKFDTYDGLWKRKVLKLCIERNAIKMFELLLNEYCFDTDSKNNSYPSLVATAAKYKNGLIIMMLLEKNKRLYMETMSSLFSMRCNDLNIASLLVGDNPDNSHNSVHSSQITYDDVLYEATCRGYMDLCRFSLQMGANVNMRNHENNTPLHVAVLYNHFDIVKLLIDAGNEQHQEESSSALCNSNCRQTSSTCIISSNSINITLENMYGETPLHYAVRNGNTDIVKLLLDKNADVNIKNIRGNTPLYDALVHGQVEIIRMLLDKKADVNAMNIHGKTPIQVALSLGKPCIIRMLVDKNQDISLHNKIQHTPLHVAASGGNIDLVSLLTETHSYINVKNNIGDSPLHCAAFKGYVNIIGLLITKNADMNLQNNFGETPLHVAVYNGHVNAVRMLLNANSDSSLVDNEGDTPLHVAVRNCNYFSSDEVGIKLIKLLKKKEININAQNKDGNTLLHLAVFLQRIDIIKLIIEENIDLNIKNKKELTPLNETVICENVKILNFLTENYNSIFSSDRINSLLFYSIKYGRVDNVKFLIDRFESIHTKNELGNTPLHIAVQFCKTDIIKLLLDKNADANAQNVKSSTPLHEALKFCSADIAAIPVQDDISKGNSLLHNAVIYRKSDMVKLLIEKGVDINVQNKDGDTPLHYAVTLKDNEIVKYLIDSNARTNIKNTSNNTPITDALCHGQFEILKLLLKNVDGFKKQNLYDSSLHETVINDYVDIVKMLLCYRVNINYQDKKGNTPLHIAVKFCKTDIIKLLLDKNPDVNAQNIKGSTPLHEALKFCYGDITSMLVLYNPDINIKNSKENTLFHNAVISRKSDIIKLLLDKGVDMNVKNKDGDTPLHYAVGKSDNEIVKCLLDSYEKANKKSTRPDVFYHGQFQILKVLLKIDDGFERRKHFDLSYDFSLHRAVVSGYADIIAMLVGYNADIHIKDSRGNTLLHNAVISRKFDIIKLLIDKGIDINTQNKDGDTPLHKAVVKKDNEIVKYLIFSNAKADIKNNNNSTPIGDALCHSQFEILKVLLKDVEGFKRQNIYVFSIHEAVIGGYVNIVRMLLSHGVDINYQDEKGNTPLHIAVQNCKADIVKILLDENADVNAQSAAGRTPLHEALEFCHVDIAAMLVQYNADIHIKDSKGNTLLHNAVVSRKSDIIKLLIDKGIDINAQNKDGDTPLHYAVAEKDNDIVKCLIDNNAKANIKNTNNTTPIAYAFRHSQFEILKLLIKDVEIFKKQNVYVFSLHKAVIGGYIDIVRILLGHGVNIDYQDKKGNTPLHIAVQYRKTDIIKILLDENADINAQNDEGSTPLHEALKFCSADIAAMLVRYKADINKKDCKGNTLLHNAVISRKYNVIKLLIDKGVDINAQNKDGDTPLHYAVAANDREIIQYLVACNAKATIINTNKNSPIADAICHGGFEILQLMLKNIEGFKKQNVYVFSIHEAVIGGYLDIVRMLLCYGVNIDYQDKKGNTPLHIAVQYYKTDIIKLLLDENADVNAQNFEGSTPLLEALKFCYSDIATMLVQCDADINIKDSEGNTLLHYAVISRNFDIIKLLIDKGVDINAQNKKGNTPLHYAVAKEDNEMVKYLIDNNADSDIENADKATPIRDAVFRCQFDIVKLLLKWG